MLNRCVLDNFFQLQQISTNIGWGTPDLFHAISWISASLRAFRQYYLVWIHKNSNYNKLDNNNNSNTNHMLDNNQYNALKSAYLHSYSESSVLLWGEPKQNIDYNNNYKKEQVRVNKINSVITSLQSVIAFSKWSATWRVAKRRKQMTDQRLVLVTLWLSAGWQKLAAFQRGQKWPQKKSSGVYLLFLRQMRRFCA